MAAELDLNINPELQQPLPESGGIIVKQGIAIEQPANEIGYTPYLPGMETTDNSEGEDNRQTVTS